MNNRLIQIINRGLEQGLTPLALAARIEKEFAMTQQHLCRDCGQPMKTDVQEMLTTAPIEIVTCMNRACTLWSVTLSTDVYFKLSDERWDEYRKVVADLKAMIAKRGEQS